MNTDRILFTITDVLAMHIPDITAQDAITIAHHINDRLDESWKQKPTGRETARKALQQVAQQLDCINLNALLQDELDIPEHLRNTLGRETHSEPEPSNDDGEEDGLRDLAGEQTEHIPEPSGGPTPPEPSDEDLTDMEALLLDRLAAHGPDAKVKSAALIDDLDLSAKEAGLILREVMQKGYCEKVQLKPMALWRALKDSGGNPPVHSIQKEVPVTKCPPRYAAGYADLKIGS